MAKKSLILRIGIPILLILVAVIALAIYLGQQKPKEIVLSGSLEARTVNVGSLYGGRVTRVLVDEGAAVAAGQVLLIFETETAQRQLAEQDAAIASARAALAKGIAGPRSVEISRARSIASNDEVTRRRMAALYAQGIISKEALDQATTKARTSADDLRILEEGTRKEDIAAQRAQLEQQLRHAESLRKQLTETEVKSTVAGVVQSFPLRVGDLAAPNQPVAEILEADQLWVRVFVPETLLGLVHTGQSVRVKVDTFPDQAFTGRIATIASQGEYTPRNIQTRAQRAEQVFGVKVLVDPGQKLKAGMAAEVDLGVKGRA